MSVTRPRLPPALQPNVTLVLLNVFFILLLQTWRPCTTRAHQTHPPGWTRTRTRVLGGRPDGPSDSGATGTWGRSGVCLPAPPLTSAAPQTGTLSAPDTHSCSQEQELCSLLPPREPPSVPGRCSSRPGRCSPPSPRLLLSPQSLLQPPGVRTPSQEPPGVFLPQQSWESRPASRGRDSGTQLLLSPACLFSAAPPPSIPTPPRSDRCS